MNYKLLLCFFILFLVSCTKITVTTPVFDVTTEKTSFAKGERVLFNISGDPNLITFFSGEPLNNYAYKDGRIILPDRLTASFTTGIAYGTQPDLLSVWVSKDFNGIYTIDNVLKATWSNNITKDFAMAPKSYNSSSSSKVMKSGELDLYPEADTSKPFYLAFRYYKLPDAIAGTQRNWFVRSVDVQLGNILGSTQVSKTGDFEIVYDEHFTDPTLMNNTITSTTMTIRAPSALGGDTVQVWAISNPIIFDKINYGPDRGIPLKGYRDDAVRTYEYIFKTPGTYTVTFVAKNSNIYGSSPDIVKQIPITITP